MSVAEETQRLEHSTATEHFSMVPSPNVTRIPVLLCLYLYVPLKLYFQTENRNAADKAPIVGGTVFFAVHMLRSLILSVFGLVRLVPFQKKKKAQWSGTEHFIVRMVNALYLFP